MTDEAARGQHGKQLQRALLSAAAIVVVVLVGGFLAWSAACPCDYTPGGWLFGDEREEPVNDWTFANQVALCQIQVRVGLLPHAINLNCFATRGGDLYLSCSNCDGKRWSGVAANDGWARLRLDGTVYPVMLTRVLDPGELAPGLPVDFRRAGIPCPVGQYPAYPAILLPSADDCHDFDLVAAIP